MKITRVCSQLRCLLEGDAEDVSASESVFLNNPSAVTARSYARVLLRVGARVIPESLTNVISREVAAQAVANYVGRQAALVVNHLARAVPALPSHIEMPGRGGSLHDVLSNQRKAFVPVDIRWDLASAIASEEAHAVVVANRQEIMRTIGKRLRNNYVRRLRCEVVERGIVLRIDVTVTPVMLLKSFV